MTEYRALLSVPIVAASDDDAMRLGFAYANSLRHPGGPEIAGHLELVGEVHGDDDIMKIVRVVDAEPDFLDQLPDEWL